MRLLFLSASRNIADHILFASLLFFMLAFPGLHFLCVERSFQIHYLSVSPDNSESLLQFLGKAADMVCYYLFCSSLLPPSSLREENICASIIKWMSSSVSLALQTLPSGLTIPVGTIRYPEQMHNTDWLVCRIMLIAKVKFIYQIYLPIIYSKLVYLM